MSNISKKLSKPIIREIQKFHISYKQFFVVIFAMFNFINLFLTPMALFGIVPLTLESYLSIMGGLAVVAFMASTILYKIGSFQEAVLQTFDLQQKTLAVRNTNYSSCLIAEKMKMTPGELEADKKKWERSLSLEGIE